MERYELVVIGSGPAGEKAAVKAGYFGHKVALIEKAANCGGAGVNTGTLPSKTLKETALYLSGKYDKGLYGIDRDISGEASVENFLFRKNYVVETESQEVRENILRHQVKLYKGNASFVDPHHILIQGEKDETIYADHIIIATGSSPTHPPSIPFDHQRVHDSDTILDITRFPQSIAILGAGVIGLEYATIFSTMGCKVYLINRGDKILTFVDQEIASLLLKHMREDGIDLLFNKSVQSIEVPPKPEEDLKITLESGEIFSVDMFLFAAGRNGNVQGLHLEKAGVDVDNRENIIVNEKYQTKVPHIYAVGDVIGFPALASTSMDQGRVAVAHIFQMTDIEQIARVLPYGIYTIPEISTVGISEEDAKKQNLSYAVGIARHPDMPRGKIMGAKDGMLKLVFDKESGVILGVSIIGHLATELIHYGIELIHTKKTLSEVIGRVYNVPTLHELYKYAAYDGLSTLAGHRVKP
jgi:NAD(P) transhydrogenase